MLLLRPQTALWIIDGEHLETKGLISFWSISALHIILILDALTPSSIIHMFLLHEQPEDEFMDISVVYLQFRLTYYQSWKNFVEYAKIEIVRKRD